MPAEPKRNITIGCDPEVFLADKSGIVSAHNLIPGTKKIPHAVKYGAVQVDGLAAEINTEPTQRWDYFSMYVKTVMQELRNLAPKHELKIQPVHVFDEKYFKGLPDESKLLGCDPDYNAWTGLVNPAPTCSIPTMRTAAGHIHIGWTKVDNPMDETHFEDCRIVAKQLDYCLGVYTLLWDNDSRRRDLYGKAGAFRPKKYGIEYRTPSNMWLRHEHLYTHVFNMAYTAIEGLISGNSPVFEQKYGDAARRVIDENDYTFVRDGKLKNSWHQFQRFDWPRW